jgi:hypothetical protein
MTIFWPNAYRNFSDRIRRGFSATYVKMRHIFHLRQSSSITQQLCTGMLLAALSMTEHGKPLLRMHQAERMSIVTLPETSLRQNHHSFSFGT